MKKIISSIMLVLFLSSPSFSASSTDSINYPYLDFALNTAIGATSYYTAMGLYYYYKNLTSTVSPTGDISKPTTAVWIDLSDMSPKTKDVNAKIPFGSLSALADKKDADGNPIYPNIKTALTDGLTSSPVTKDSSEGQLVAIGYGQDGKPISSVIVTSRTVGEPVWGGATPNTTPTTNVYDLGDGRTQYVFKSIVDEYHYFKTYIFTGSGPVPVAKPRTPSDAAAELTGNGAAQTIPAPATLASNYEAEIDRMLQDPDYVPVFSDATTGLPYTPPPSSTVATPAQIAEHNKNVAVAAAGAAAATAAGTAVASGSGSSASYRAAADAAQAAAAANPGDAGLAQKAKDAAAAAAGAKLAEDKLKAEQAKNEADKTANNAITAPNSGDAYGSSDTNDYGFGTRFTKFMSDMKSSTLFTLPSTLLGNIPSSSQSDFNVSFGRFGSTNFDLANFGSAITLLRSLVLIIFSVVSFKIITLKGGGG